MVQSAARLRLPHPRRWDAGHLRPYGDVAALRHRRAAPGPDRAGPLRSWAQRHDGRRGASGWRPARTRVALERRRFTTIASPQAPAYCIGMRVLLTALVCVLMSAPALAVDRNTVEIASKTG